MSSPEAARVDRWLWAVRLYRTRSAASDACRAGHVRVNDVRAKPSTVVRVGDTISARAGGRERIVEVARVIESRVGAPLAAECFVDHSPPPPPADPWLQVARRERGAGRPSKRDRRQLDQLNRARERRP